MIYDANLTFCTALPVSSAIISTNTIDLGSIRELAKGQPVYVDLFCTAANTGSTTGTLAITLISDSAVPVTAGGTTVMTIYPATAGLLSSAGHMKRMLIPEDLPQRYLGLSVATAVAALAAEATFAAYVTIGQDSD